MFLWRIYVAGDNKTCSVLHIICPIVNKLEVFREIFMKSPVSNFTEIRPVGTRCGHTDGYDEANKRFSRLCERA